MYSYGNLQTPSCPGPEALIQLYNPVNLSVKSQEIKAIVDTGAVMTAVPESVILELENNSGRKLELEYDVIEITTATGDPYELRTYRLQISISDTRGNIDHMGEIEIISIPGKEYALIGRDILNQHKVVFNARRIPALWGFNCHAENCSIS